MLTPDDIREIRDLAGQGHSQRTIARMTRHSRRAIARALAGARIRRLPRLHSANSTSDSGPTFSTDYHRCKSCGRLVKLPCLACRIEYLQVASRYAKKAA